MSLFLTLRENKKKRTDHQNVICFIFTTVSRMRLSFIFTQLKGLFANFKKHGC